MAGHAVVHAGLIDYAQVETSSKATTAVGVAALGASGSTRPAGLVSATFARWSTGEAASAGYVHRWALSEGPHQWLAGAGQGINTFRSRSAGDESDEARLSVRLQSEWLGPVPGGHYYALVQAASFRDSRLLAVQYNLARFPLSPELTHYHERDYEAVSLGARIALGLPRWFVRAGVTRADGASRPYIGIAYNGF